VCLNKEIDQRSWNEYGSTLDVLSCVKSSLDGQDGDNALYVPHGVFTCM